MYTPNGCVCNMKEIPHGFPTSDLENKCGQMAYLPNPPTPPRRRQCVIAYQLFADDTQPSRMTMLLLKVQLT